MNQIAKEADGRARWCEARSNTTGATNARPQFDVSGQVVRVAWYRFGATFGRRWTGYLVVVLLVGLLGGLAMGAVAAARRTQSSFPDYLASTNPSDLIVGTTFFDPTSGLESPYDPTLNHTIAHLPHVRHADTIVGFDANLVSLSSLHTHFRAGETPPVVEGSMDGEFSSQDRITIVRGRAADPSRVDEVVMSAVAARELGLHLGSRIHLGFDSDEQLLLPNCCDPSAVTPAVEITIKLVGIATLSTAVVEDDVSALSNQQAILTPALTRRLAHCCSTYTQSALQLDGGARWVTTVQREINGVTEKNLGVSGGYVAAATQSKAERAIKPESIAIGVFGGIVALATLVIVAQVIGRQSRFGDDELHGLRALGAGPAMTVGDGLLGIFGAVGVGALVAAGVAVALSPLAPIGPVRPVDPTRGYALDWSVLGLGVAVLILGLGAIALNVAFRRAPHRAARNRGRPPARGSSVARAVANWGLPAPAVTGIRFALEPGGERRAAPVRSAILGAALAVTVVTTTLTFGASLSALVSHPALYGWNWNYVLLSGFAGDEDLPQHQTATLLDHDRYVSGWTGVYFAVLGIDGHSVPVLGATPHSPVGPPLLSGHGFDGANEVVLGTTTLAQLHKHVGDTVTVSNGVTKSKQLVIVGTATMPAIGTGGNVELDMGTGALLAYQLIPASVRNLQGSPVAGPNAVLIRTRSGVNPKLALRSLRSVNATLHAAPDGSGGVVSVLHPAEIADYRSIGSTPAFLAAGLATGAMTGLGLALVASVRRRRRDLALLKTLGFSRRQLAAVIAWQSTVAVVIGTTVGVIIGIVLGHYLWDLFAHAINAVPAPSIPGLTVVFMALGALVLANVVAFVPGRLAAQTPTAILLRAE